MKSTLFVFRSEKSGSKNKMSVTIQTCSLKLNQEEVAAFAHHRPQVCAVEEHLLRHEPSIRAVGDHLLCCNPAVCAVGDHVLPEAKKEHVKKNVSQRSKNSL